LTVHEYYRRGGANRKTMQREKIEFQKNVPVEVQLAYATGREMEDHGYGVSFMYTATDERVFFASATLNQKLQALGVKAREPIQICLRNNKETGNKNVWEVRLVNPPAGGPGIEPQESQQTVAVHQASTQQANGNTNGYVNGHHANGNGHHANGNRHHPAPPSLMTGQAQGLLEQFISAYEVLCAVEHFASVKGRPLTFTSEDFRATAVSLYIAQTRGGR
jgi:hypothetical protein